MTYKVKCGCIKAHTCDSVVECGEVKRGSVLLACPDHGGPAWDAVERATGPGTGRRRYAAGRRIKVPRSVRTARDLIRRHLREEGRELRSLAGPFNVTPATVKAIMHHGRPLSPQHIDAVIEHLNLDEFDATELRLQGAIEAGWQLHKLEQTRL